MKKTMQAILITATFCVAPGTVLAENNNDPSRDINSTSVGTRMRNAGETTDTKIGIDTNSSVGTRMGNAGKIDRSNAGVDESFTTEATTETDVDVTEAETSSRPYDLYGSDLESDVIITDGDTTRAATLDSESKSSTVNQGMANTDVTRASDVEVTRSIRQALMKTDLSTSAKNIHISTDNGVATLRGELASAEEKQKVVEIARSAAGKATVQDELKTE